MKIAILSQNQQYCSTRRHVDVATERGHNVAAFDVFRCYMNVTANSPQAHYNSKELPALDAVIKNDVRAWDLMHDSKFRCLTVKDEATGYCLAIEVDTSIKNVDVQQLLKLLITRYGRPKAIRSDNKVTRAHIEALANWQPDAQHDTQIAFSPSRVILQDFTSVPAIVDLAAMRDAMKSLGTDPSLINPQIPVDLVIAHSVIRSFGHGRSLCVPGCAGP
ncbi:MAG: hypothetical protein ACJAUZ_003151 [Flavobacteriaceae bacterium]|jgi:hypothetical protein